MNPGLDQIAGTIERLDNLTYSIQLPLTDRMHVEQLRKALPEIVDELKKGYFAAGGEDYWS